MTLRTYLSVLLTATLVCGVARAQEASVTVRVTDDTGRVVSNALVSAGFATMIKPGWGWGGGRPNIVKGFTDTNGLCSLTGKGNGGEVAVAVTKDGYYGSGGYIVIFTNVTGFIVKRWQPWNPVVDVVLKKIGNPIAMYAKRVNRVKIPVLGEAIGFDLMRGDWVAPYGKGEVVDIFFRLDSAPSRIVSTQYGDIRLFDDRLTVSFPNEGDGIQCVPVPPRGGGSVLRLPGTAPEDGYMTNLVKRVARERADKPPFWNIEEDANYFFRVRTNKDDKGNTVSALYGKIHGDFSGFDSGKLTFTYYLNPTPNDRNLEFDPKHNLFKKLSSLEEVRAP